MLTTLERESLEKQRRFENQALHSEEELRGIHAGMLLSNRDEKPDPNPTRPNGSGRVG